MGDAVIAMGAVDPVGLYPTLLGEAWSRLDSRVRRARRVDGVTGFVGTFRIERGRSAAARLVASLARMPRAAESAVTRLVVTPSREGERWVRTFPDVVLASELRVAGPALLDERFGALEFRFALEVEN